MIAFPQLFLLDLELLRQRLRLLEQLLGAGGGGDGVQDDADAFRQLIEEGEVGGVKAVERGQLDDRLHFLLEEHGQDDDVAWRSVAQSRADLDVIFGHLGEDQSLLLQSTLPH